MMPCGDEGEVINFHAVPERALPPKGYETFVDGLCEGASWAVSTYSQPRRRVCFQHFMSGLQPSRCVGFRTQPCGLGWDMAAPLALNDTIAFSTG